MEHIKLGVLLKSLSVYSGEEIFSFLKDLNRGDLFTLRREIIRCENCFHNFYEMIRHVDEAENIKEF